jgi:N-methylhydantoinase B
MATVGETKPDTAADVDVFTREIIKHRLYQVSEEAAIALENAAGTRLVVDMHDMIAALYNPKGEMLYAGTGILNHPSCAARAVKGVVKYFEDEGIFEGDVIMMNDPYSGALHSPDVFIIQPIHYEGELIAFVASFVHVSDTGSIEPGGFCPSATDCFQEGFQTRGLKLMEKGKARRDVWDTIMNMTRTPDATMMDYKSQIAAGYVAQQRMKKLADDYGVDRLLTVFDDLIAESESLFRGRLAEIPNGVYRSRKYYNIGDEVTPIELAAIKEGDALTLDLSGTGPQSIRSINATLEATEGGLFPSIYTQLAWDIVWNEGIFKCVEVVAPESSLVNCTRPAATSCASIGIITMLNSLATQALSKMLGATNSLKDRATGDWLGVHTWAGIHGQLPDGSYSVTLPTESAGGAGGGRAFKDGIDNGGDMTCLTAACSNIEHCEADFPMIYLFRRPVPDSGGPGKYRGGCSHEWAATTHNSPDRKFSLLAIPGCGIDVPACAGVFGGLPGATSSYSQFRRGNAREYPTHLADCRGEDEEHVSFGATEIAEGDILYVRHSGGGGYGDPLDREPALVLADVAKGFVTQEPARDVYGVVIDPETATVDEEATRDLRRSLRRERLGGEAPRFGGSSRAEIEPSGGRIGEYLQLSESAGKAALQCTYCGHELPGNSRWKDSVPHRKATMSAAGPVRQDHPDFSMWQFFCPNCATQLDVDIAYKDDPPLYDELSSLVRPTTEEH